jgi:hypothetical protein
VPGLRGPGLRARQVHASPPLPLKTKT